MTLSEQAKKTLANLSLKNLVKNSWILISLFAFYLSNSWKTQEKFLPFLIGFAAAVIYCLYKSETFSELKKSGAAVLCASFVSSAGAALFYSQKFYKEFTTGGNFITAVTERLGLPNEKSVLVLSVIIFVLIIPIAVWWFSRVYSYVFSSLKSIKSKLSVMSVISLAVIACGFIVCVIYIVNESDAFMTGEYIDVIFDADADPNLAQKVWMDFYGYENDLRQILFGPFAIPFFAPFYLISEAVRVVFGLEKSFVFFIMIGQVVLISLTCLMLADMLGENKKDFTVLFLVFSLSFSTCLFMIIPEQYAVVTFWLVLFVRYAVYDCEKSGLSFIGAGGTLLTSGVLFFLIYDKSVSFKENFVRWVKLFFEFIFFILVSGVLYRLFSFEERFGTYAESIAGKVSWSNKMEQFTYFVKNCIFSPETTESVQNGVLGVKLPQMEQLCIAGIIIFIAAVIGFVLNRKDRFAQICFSWVMFSFLLLGIAGWGANENGLILYSYYFGWAFISLLYLLLKRLFSLVKAEKALPWVELVCVIPIAYFNIEKTLYMVRFLIENYPGL